MGRAPTQGPRSGKLDEPFRTPRGVQQPNRELPWSKLSKPGEGAHVPEPQREPMTLRPGLLTRENIVGR